MDVDLDSGRTKRSVRYLFFRLLWVFFWNFFGKHGPRFLSPVRVFFLRVFGAKIGKDVLVCSGVKVLIPWNLEIGDRSAIAECVNFYNFKKISIGNNVSISFGAWLCTGSHDYSKTSMPLISKPITVKNNVWVAAEVFVAPGVTIESGAVVAARSVVIKNMPAWHFCGGNPCKPIKKRELS